MKTNINIFNIPDTLQLEELLDVKGGTGDNNKLCAVIGAGVKCTVAGSGACTVSGSGFCTVEGSGIIIPNPPTPSNPPGQSNPEIKDESGTHVP